MELSAQKRGPKTKVSKIRLEGNLPGVIFSKKRSQKNERSVEVYVNASEFNKIYAQAGESALVTIKTEKDSYEVLISDVQVHPVSLDHIHVTFYEVDMTEKIDTKVPVEFVGEENNEKVRANEAIVLPVLDEVEVRTLPRD